MNNPQTYKKHTNTNFFENLKNRFFEFSVKSQKTFFPTSRKIAKIDLWILGEFYFLGIFGIPIVWGHTQGVMHLYSLVQFVNSIQFDDSVQFDDSIFGNSIQLATSARVGDPTWIKSSKIKSSNCIGASNSSDSSNGPTVATKSDSPKGSQKE